MERYAGDLEVSIRCLEAVDAMASQDTCLRQLLQDKGAAGMINDVIE
jgi:hypothetical protein